MCIAYAVSSDAFSVGLGDKSACGYCSAVLGDVAMKLENIVVMWL